MIRLIMLSALAFGSLAAPALAQAMGTTDQGPSLLWVWGWILIAGVLFFIIGTSLGVRGQR